MGASMTVTVSDRFPEIAAKGMLKSEEAVRKAEFNIVMGAKMRSRVRTGAMRAGWENRINDLFSGVVLNLVDYTVYNEFGTGRRGFESETARGLGVPAWVDYNLNWPGMTSRPMLRPAIEDARPIFETDLRDAFQ